MPTSIDYLRRAASTLRCASYHPRIPLEARQSCEDILRYERGLVGHIPLSGVQTLFCACLLVGGLFHRGSRPPNPAVDESSLTVEWSGRNRSGHSDWNTAMNGIFGRQSGSCRRVPRPAARNSRPDTETRYVARQTDTACALAKCRNVHHGNYH